MATVPASNADSLHGPKRNSRRTPPHFLSDLYSFQWTSFQWRLPLVSATAVAMCLLAGVIVGHPGAGLIAGGGAFSVAFGANQRIRDSRLVPMGAATLGVAVASLIGFVAGHRSLWLLLAAGICSFFYGYFAVRNTGVSWVGQQSTIALLIASAFESSLRDAFVRASLLAAGALIQTIATSAGLRLLPDLPRDLLAVSVYAFQTLDMQKRELVRRLRRMPKALPSVPNRRALRYAIGMCLTVLIATEIDRRSGIQSGYWIPMTALLVQKPAFFETLSRASLRVLGTLAGAYLSSLLVAHAPPRPIALAGAAAFFAFASFATNAVNYALYSACLTSYIVFLLSLNEIPGPLIAERRALCTLLGAAIAVVIHLDALRKHRTRCGRSFLTSI